jgi:hypothetical protein
MQPAAADVTSLRRGHTPAKKPLRSQIGQRRIHRTEWLVVQLHADVLEKAEVGLGELARGARGECLDELGVAFHLALRRDAEPDVFFRANVGHALKRADKVPADENREGCNHQRANRQFAREQHYHPRNGVDEQDVPPPEQEVVQ